MIAINLIGSQLEENRKAHNRAKARKFRGQNPGYFSALRRKKSPIEIYESERHFQLKYSYGISLVEYKAILAAQGGVCASCGDPPPLNHSRHSNLAVDHDHQTNVVRGLLCVRCNTALGLLKEDDTRIEKLRNYLKAARTK